MNSATEKPPISLPGYTLVSRLGSGGYGEVWLAQAPGGLTKAVKFVYGDHLGKRAEIELKALERIKEVRHPFLLSLERIEVVDGRLVVVTELAEASLKDRFDQCLTLEKPGIPREELLGYLRDAADALDFLSERHSLQHLDVKPENLLLVGGHVKVADFGLVKDVEQSQASLVGGLTPLYSAPEVFQGAPTRYSDQYSLAVLYVELLTGSPPFGGQTPAELTLQHMHDEPDLAHVVLGDRYALARALAKDPKQRYPTCGDMVLALLSEDRRRFGRSADRDERYGRVDFEATGKNGKTDAAAPTVDPSPPPTSNSKSTARCGVVTEMFDDSLCGGDRELSKSMLVEIEPRVSAAVQQRPPMAIEGRDFRPRPLLVIGIGGTAAAVLQHLRASLARKYGDRVAIPSIQMLLIDSDPRAILNASRGGAERALLAEETLSLPLRRPQEYRDRSAELGQWLSRRWLYNIPKSLRTEGLRPLGRLAFADHARRVGQRIRMALAAALDHAALQASAQATCMTFCDDAIDIKVVASIAGGTGSGMSLDVGYAVKSALKKFPQIESNTVGIMLYSTGCDPRHCDLAKVNAYSWLTEFNHFNRPGGSYPGDATCGIASYQAGSPTFDSAYLVDLGQSLDETEFDNATENVAHYLAIDALTPAALFFAQCRAETDDASPTHAPLRTFSLHTVPAASEEVILLAANLLRRCVVLRWAGVEADSESRFHVTDRMAETPCDSLRDTNQIVRGAGQLVGRMQLQMEGLASNARSLLESQFGADWDVVIGDLWDQLSNGKKSVALADVHRTVEGLFASPADSTDSTAHYILRRPLDSVISPLAMKLGADLAQWILAKLDDRQERMVGAEKSIDWLISHFESVERDAQRLAAGLAKQWQLQIDVDALDDAANVRRHQVADEKALANSFRLRIDLVSVQAAALLARRLKLEIRNVKSALVEFGRHLRHMAQSSAGTGQEDAATMRSALDLLAIGQAQLVEQFDELADACIAEQGGLFQTVMGNTRVRSQMLEELARQATELVRGAANRISSLDALLASDDEGRPLEKMALLAGKTTPKFLQHGGTLRRLAMWPTTDSTSDQTEMIKQSLGEEATIVPSSSPELTLCCEAWALPLPYLALDLIQHRRDYADFASRVQTRSDIAWTPLVVEK